MESPLVNIEAEGTEWLEWSAAMYESRDADYGTNDAYARTAHHLAEEIEYSVYDVLNGDVDSI